MELDVDLDGGTHMLMSRTELVGGYGVPMDPMDLLQCDSCQ